jgi:hypothetical protein
LVAISLPAHANGGLRLFTNTAYDERAQRVVTRAWTRVKTVRNRRIRNVRKADPPRKGLREAGCSTHRQDRKARRFYTR